LETDTPTHPGMNPVYVGELLTRPVTRKKMRLANTHVGWQNEHLARFLLSQMAFVASPTMPGDDVGVDLICTLYEVTESEKGATVLAPRNAIAVQIKSSVGAWDVTKQTCYLRELETPYFIAVVNQSEQQLDLYSGRYLPHMFSFRGEPRKLELVPVRELEGYYREGDDQEGYRLKCPFIVSLSAGDSDEIIQENRKVLREEARAMLNAISSRQNKEYIFEVSRGKIEIFTGPGSARHFEYNYLLRLAEALHNIAWIMENGKEVDDDKLAAYVNAVQAFESTYTMPEFLQSAFKRLKKQL